jgi:hypothetical protein
MASRHFPAARVRLDERQAHRGIIGRAGVGSITVDSVGETVKLRQASSG